MTNGEYVIFAGQGSERPRRMDGFLKEAGQWQKVPFEGPAEIYVQPRCDHIAANGMAGVVLLGRVFARHGPPVPAASIDDATARDFQSGAIGELFARFWGAYVALTPVDGMLRVVRDPSAALPCYYARTRGGVVIGSSVAVLIEAGLGRPMVDMNRLAANLYRDELPCPETVLDGIYELLPGDSLVVGDSLRVDHHWSPWDHVAIDRVREFEEQAERLARAIQNSLSAWTRSFERILIGVSGGLDSSLVACFANRRAGGSLGLTLASADPAGDERAYARTLCEALGMQLIETHYDLSDIDIAASVSARLPRPTGRTIAQGYNAVVNRTVSDNGIDAFFTGNGGDNVFAYSQSAAAIADRFLHEGLTAGTWRTMGDVSRLTGCSMFQAARAARRILSRRGRYSWQPDRRLLARDFLDELDREPLLHPWLDAPEGALPGKLSHVAALLRIQRHLDGIGQMGGAALVNPLMSQPVVETCLAIPSWMWCRGGMNRAAARHAFRDLLPPAIVWRRSKGSPNGFGAQIIANNRERIAERLLGGHLARSGIIDRQALERRLRSDRPDWGSVQTRVLELLEAEAWTDHWRHR